MEAASVGCSRRRRLHKAGWGLLLLWSGAVMLMPGATGVLWHVWLIGAGAILLGAGAVGLGLGLEPTWGTIILGVVGLVSGTCGLAGVTVPLVGLALMLFGLAYIVFAARPSLAPGR